MTNNPVLQELRLPRKWNERKVTVKLFVSVLRKADNILFTSISLQCSDSSGWCAFAVSLGEFSAVYLAWKPAHTLLPALTCFTSIHTPSITWLFTDDKGLFLRCWLNCNVLLSNHSFSKMFCLRPYTTILPPRPWVISIRVLRWHSECVDCALGKDAG